MNKKRIEEIVSTYPTGLACENELKYRLSYDGAQIYIQQPDDEGWEPIRFFALAQIIYDYQLEYVYDEKTAPSVQIPTVVGRDELLELLDKQMGAAWCANDERVYAFVGHGTIIHEAESIGVEELDDCDYVLHPQIKALDLMNRKGKQ